MPLVASILLVALTRAEILARFKAPVITQADGLVKVYADCPEDLRREYQMPIASFAAETVKTLYAGSGRKPERFRKPGIAIHVGDVRTNLTDVATRVSTNGEQVLTRIYVRSPRFADIERLRLEVIRAFSRCVDRREISAAEAGDLYRRADPAIRAADTRQRLERWLAGEEKMDDEEGLRLMRRVIEPGKASRRDVLTFASRLFLYPPQHDVRFAGRFDCLSFRAALDLAAVDPCVRIMAALKANEMPLFGGGRGEDLMAAAEAYRIFLGELGRFEKDVRELRALLDDADEKLNVAFEKATRTRP